MTRTPPASLIESGGDVRRRPTPAGSVTRRPSEEAVTATPARSKTANHSLQRRVVGQRHGEVAQADRAEQRGRRADAVPDVQTQMVVVPAGADEDGRELVAAQGHVETEQAVVEVLRRIKARRVQVHVADDRVGVQARPRAWIAFEFGDKLVDVDAGAGHAVGVQLAVAHRPDLAREVPGQFDAVALGVGQIEGEVRVVVRVALDRRARLRDLADEVGEFQRVGTRKAV